MESEIWNTYIERTTRRFNCKVSTSDFIFKLKSNRVAKLPSTLSGVVDEG